MRFFRLLLIALCLSLPLMASPSYAQEYETPVSDITPTQIIQNFYTTLEATMKEGQQLGFEGRYQKLAPVIRATFNLPLMTRYAVGAKWRKMPPDTQQQIIAAFSDFSIATYASRFTKYDGEIFSVLGSKAQNANNIIVETTLTPQGEDAVSLNYLVRKDEQGIPRIADVYLDASISELAMRRADFSAVLKREGPRALITSLQEKTAKMKAPKTPTKDPKN